jgi:3-hydroxy-3-methylglutaryl CoA synthase/uncharacterized OB-fold protein
MKTRPRWVSRPDGPRSRPRYFATADPPYLDKTNAAGVHAALGLDANCFAVDMGGAVRSGAGALKAALDAPEPALAVLSDTRMGLPGGVEEAASGDAATAFLCGEGDEVIAEYLGTTGLTSEFLDRWRAPGDLASKVWEERFGEYMYVPLGRQALKTAMERAELRVEDVHHFIVTGVHARAARVVLGSAGAKAEAVIDDLSGSVGNTGTAHAGLMLAAALDRAGPNQIITVLLLADGATVMMFRTTDAITRYRPEATVQEQIDSGKPGLSYANFLTWKNMLSREPPRRPDPDRPAAPPSQRSEPWKYGFNASRCTSCGTRHLPPQRVCVHCQATDRMTLERMADLKATIATYTIDRLAFSMSPPVVAAVVDFDGGGRFACELTDVDPNAVKIGDRVEMTFRRLYTADGVHNYFWKARPVRRSS